MTYPVKVLFKYFLIEEIFVTNRLTLCDVSLNSKIIVEISRQYFQ